MDRASVSVCCSLGHAFGFVTPFQCLLLGTDPYIRPAAPQAGSGRHTTASAPHGSAGAPGAM